MGFVESLKSGKIHFWMSIYGISVDVGQIYLFIWYISGPGIPPNIKRAEDDAFFKEYEARK